MIDKFYFNSHDTECRNPFGAVLPGTEIRFRVNIAGDDIRKVILKVFSEGTDTVQEMEMEKEGGEAYTVSFTPPQRGLYFYHFIVVDNGIHYFGNSEDSKGGLSIGYDNEYSLRQFQITCHEYSRKAPEWYKRAVFYQIFPDRFFNGNPDGRIDNVKPGSFIYGSWYDKPYYVRNEKGGIERWDFMGGNLKGIEARIDYLKELGIDGIYLNPVFKARSNHRYDTGDYHTIDPMLGTNEYFKELMETLKRKGIRVILDGVFNHTGSDSIYFNALGNYDSVGAAQSPDSPYHSWFNFRCHPGDYECWWGVTDLPNVNENDPSYSDFILNMEDGVIPYWLRMGASGWRLDVADELPDEFIAGIRKSMENLDQKKDDESEYILIGEVWEDASNKIAYSRRREYLLGDELHGVMNYPLKDSLISYLKGQLSAEGLYRNIMSLYENYPEEAFYSGLNSLSTHDTRRIRTEVPDSDLMKLAVMILFTMPGVPCIYYGDEAGLDGERDPYNRASYPWGREDMEYMEMYSEAVVLRRSRELFTTGRFLPFFTGEVFGYIRHEGEKAVAVMINRGTSHTEVHREVSSGDFTFRIDATVPSRGYLVLDL